MALKGSSVCLAFDSVYIGFGVFPIALNYSHLRKGCENIYRSQRLVDELLDLISVWLIMLSLLPLFEAAERDFDNCWFRFS